MTDGKSVTVTDDYLKQSIEKPDAMVVKGFDPVMPVIEIPPAELHEIIEYLDTLK